MKKETNFANRVVVEALPMTHGSAVFVELDDGFHIGIFPEFWKFDP